MTPFQQGLYLLYLVIDLEYKSKHYSSLILIKTSHSSCKWFWHNFSPYYPGTIKVWWTSMGWTSVDENLFRYPFESETLSIGRMMIGLIGELYKQVNYLCCDCSQMLNVSCLCQVDDTVRWSYPMIVCTQIMWSFIFWVMKCRGVHP